jgi:hypothetical protein
MHPRMNAVSRLNASRGISGNVETWFSMYMKPSRNPNPSTRVTHTYGACQPVIAAWFQAKLNRISPRTPVMDPPRSSWMKYLWNLFLAWSVESECAPLGRSGRTSHERIAVSAITMAEVKNAHGHHDKANSAANVAPRTIPVGDTAAKRLKASCYGL